jgi:hypothetical protein
MCGSVLAMGWAELALAGLAIGWVQTGHELTMC